jgi:hypothetical protein
LFAIEIHYQYYLGDMTISARSARPPATPALPQAVPTLALALVLGACPLFTACGEPAQDGGNAETETDDGDDVPGDGDGDTGDGDTGDGDPGDGDGDPDDEPNLGDTPNVLCEAALVNLDIIVMENAGGAPDAMTIEAAYVDTGLQEFVRLAGAVTGRVDAGVLIDDAAILAALADGSSNAMIDVEWTIYLAMQQYIRHELADVAATLPDPANDPALLHARWDAAWCYWNGGLRPLAQIADGVLDDAIEAEIDAGFEWGHAGIEGEVEWAIDEWTVPAAKQVVEKSQYTMAHRLIMQWSIDAAANADAGSARAAHGAFQLIEDRVATKNTPGIAIVETALLGDPAQIDPDDILLQMNIAFAKRTRRYTDAALPEVDGTIGTPEAYVGANEGATYSKLIEPFMLDLDGFDRAAYQSNWASFIDAVRADDLAAAEAASAELTLWNCAYQTALGIAECTSSIDEQ